MVPPKSDFWRENSKYQQENCDFGANIHINQDLKIPKNILLFLAKNSNGSLRSPSFQEKCDICGNFFQHCDICLSEKSKDHRTSHKVVYSSKELSHKVLHGFSTCPINPQTICSSFGFVCCTYYRVSKQFLELGELCLASFPQFVDF